VLAASIIIIIALMMLMMMLTPLLTLVDSNQFDDITF
jgi:nitrogen fixation-related uncharacterized protein